MKLAMDTMLDNPEYYINREFSAIAFNQRVLMLANDERVPLLERMRFLSICSSNLDEFFEILTWKQLGKHQKPIAIYNPDGFYDGLLSWFERSVQDGFYSPEQMSLFTQCTSVDELATFLETSEPHES